MNRYTSDFLFFLRWTGLLCGSLLIISSGFYFFNVSAEETETDEKRAATQQNLVIGRLAFSSRRAGPSAPEGRIIISNPDGSGQSSLPISLSIDPTQPAWSPDGTRIVFVGRQPPVDIHVINADGSGLMNLTNTDHPIGETHPTWSASGKIAYEREGKIWVMNEDGSGQTQFPGITQNATDPAWSPDGTKLAFVMNGEIRVINADGTNQQQITMNGANSVDPAWSPDGLKIIFKKSGGIGVITADGTNEAFLTNNVSDSQPSWSPDGTKIAFRRDGIYTMNADGSNQIRIVADVINFPNCCDIIYEKPIWEPVAQTPNTFSISGRITDSNLPVSGATVNLSGTTDASTTTDAVGNYQFSGLPAGGNYKISPSQLRTYFTPANNSFNNLTSNQTADFELLGICRGGRCVKNGKLAFSYQGDIFTVNPEGTNSTNITNNGSNDNEPDYSPDGLNIIFSSDRDGNREIYRMDAGGSFPVRLTNNAATDSTPNYSPDGKSIVFASDRDGNFEIYKMNADGTNQIRLTNNTSRDTEPSFSPDGSKIVYINREIRSGAPTLVNLWTMNADGTNPQPLTDTGGPAPAYERPSYSPDGSKIIFAWTTDTAGQVMTTYTINSDGTNRMPAPIDGRSSSYSPDGNKIAFTCCYYNFDRKRLFIANVDGSSKNTLYTSQSISLSPNHPDWQAIVTRRASFDFDGDGRSDISYFRPSNSGWYISRSTEGLWVPVWGLATDVLVPEDYDGDLETDLAVWRPSTGDFYILNSFDNTLRVEEFGLEGDIPTGGDWDGDGKADLAVYREGTQGVFYYRGSMGNPQGNITFTPWGTFGDKAVSADYDGDGRTDAAIYRNGDWYINQSSNGQLFATSFGLATDVPVPADYDGDGKTDIAVYRDGIWYLLRSSQGFTAFQFGIADDIPAPADYDGDGLADATIYRDGVWWILNSQSGNASSISFGTGSDEPIPSVYVR